MLLRILARGSGSLATARPPEQRFIGACRPVTFDPCDVPRDRFVIAGLAWRGVRSGRIDPVKCGVWSIGLAGVWFVAGSAVRDLAALNKREMLPWDYWGISRDMSPRDPAERSGRRPP